MVPHSGWEGLITVIIIILHIILSPLIEPSEAAHEHWNHAWPRGASVNTYLALPATLHRLKDSTSFRISKQKRAMQRPHGASLHGSNGWTQQRLHPETFYSYSQRRWKDPWTERISSSKQIRWYDMIKLRQDNTHCITIECIINYMIVHDLSDL